MKKNILPVLLALLALTPAVMHASISLSPDEPSVVSPFQPRQRQMRMPRWIPEKVEAYDIVTLQPDKGLSAQCRKSNTIYEVSTKFDLRGKTFHLPKDCVLRFNGGCITGGEVVFDNTLLDGLVRFDDCSFKGTLTNREAVLSWFGASPAKEDNSDIINQVLDIIPEVLIVDALYPIAKTIVINHAVTLRGVNGYQGIYSIMVWNAEYGFKTTDHITAISFTHGSINAYGIAIIGDPYLYTSRNTHDDDGPNGGPIETCGIFCGIKQGSIGVIEGCSIVGFTYGIRSIGTYIEMINSTYFSSCRYGLYTAWTSDYICHDCHFNTNMHNTKLFEKGIDDTNPRAIRDTGAAVLIKGAGMARFLDCKFEFNFIHFIIDEGCIIMNLENCMFDAATHSSIFIYNEDHPKNWLTTEVQHPTVNCINISNNTFARGSRCELSNTTSVPGSAVVYVREANDRGMNINFVNNVVVDSIEIDQQNVNYEKTIFRVYNNGVGGVINSVGNDFSCSKAETVAEVVPGSDGRFTIKDTGSNCGRLSHEFRNNSVLDIQKMEVLPDGRISVWQTLTDGDTPSRDIIYDMRR